MTRSKGPVLKQVLALMLGAMSGLLADRIGLPLPWMLGPMLGTTIASMSNAPVQGPDWLRPFVIPVIGVLLGAGMTAQMLQDAVSWGPTMVLLIPFLIVSAGLSYAFYRRVGRYDQVTAYFCAMPGGLNDMLILGGAAGGQEKRIALAHASRIFVVVLFVVLFYGFVLGVNANGAKSGNWTAIGALAPLDWVILAGCAIVGGPMGALVRLPATQILGPMLLSGVAHVTFTVTVSPPSVLVIVAQIVVGTVIGCRFLGATPREVGRDIGLATVSSLLMIGVAIAFAYAVTAATGTSTSQTFLAYSPGGLTEMSLLAYAMDQDIAYVTTAHIVRITAVILLAAPVFNLIRRR